MITYVVPFYSDGKRLVGTLKALKDAADRLPIRQVILAHNGRPLSREEEDFLRKHFFDGVELVHSDVKGLGAGCKLAISRVAQPYLLITGSDLPFGFTDINAMLGVLRESPFIKVIIGSKGHPLSKISGGSLIRSIVSNCFWILRKVVLTVRSPKDTQGSVFMESKLAKQLNEACQITDYLYTMEIVTLAQRKGFGVVEVPVECDMRGGGKSSVSIVRDSLRAIYEILRFSVRLSLNDLRERYGKQHSPNSNN